MQLRGITTLAAAKQARKLAAQGLTDARRAVSALRPQQMQARNLPDALSAALPMWIDGRSLHCKLDRPSAWEHLAPDVEDQLFRLVQEALHNVLKHANATRLLVELSQSSGETTILIANDGVGMARGAPLSVRSAGFGLQSMQQRAESIGAGLQWQAGEPRGTQVLISLGADPTRRCMRLHGSVSAKALGVLIADDHPVVRMGLVGIVNGYSGYRVVAAAESGEQAIALYALHKPDLVLMDLRMPNCDGVSAIERIREQAPQARIVILTTFNDEEDIWRGLRAGAKAYLLKDSPSTEVMTCMAAVLAGQSYLPPRVASKLAMRMEGDPLSSREQEVLNWLVTGRSNKEIARATGITEGTVKLHATSVMAKLSAKTRTEAVATALRRGLVRLDP